eukprot:CAMPEP_0184870192 /NCGR_PEP_ID=MMETSP0580-20130426/36806_1 /TAXON_ID=1118495 /ORGANISM="Dactyliosolen fragilissimus" /LENGTH=100 /DNA_ID=CAMNT_0027372163 /DNA_START=458 /DNA_END=760 /DNA_ORIENTATION=-
MVESIDSSNDSFIQYEFYDRLSKWKTKVIARHERRTNQYNKMKDEILTKLVHEEEEVWKSCSSTTSQLRPRRAWNAYLGEAVLVAAAAYGVGAFMRKFQC